MVRSTRFLLVVTLAAALLPAGPAQAATPPPGFTDRTVVSGLDDPTAMAVAPDGRVFITEQAGAVRIVKNGALLPNPFVNLTVDSSGERGAIGITLDPSFPVAPYIYVHYTVPGAHNRVSRFTINGDQFVGGSELPILDLPTLSGATNHNGGGIHFGPDGLLYVGVGENANGPLAQQLGTPFGKILRITSTGAVPGGNPFVGVGGADARVWALGFRNPFTFAIDPITEAIFVNDVGSSGAGVREEINYLFPGVNYGWPIVEGFSDDSRFLSPIHAYDHGDGSCAIAGGVFIDPRAWSAPAGGGNEFGRYLYSDLCGNYIHGLGSTGFVSAISNPVDLARSPAGGIYYLARGSGTLGEIRVNQKAYLRNALNGGPPTTTIAADHPAGGISLACDWNGDRDDSLGVFIGGYWHITTDGTGPVDLVIHYGGVGDQAVCGDWNGDGTDTIGVWQNQHFYLRNSNSPGAPAVSVFYGGHDGDRVVVGDWNGDGTDTIGVNQFDHFFLRNTNTPGPPDIDAHYGTNGNQALAGDWNGDGTDTIGVYLYNHFYLRDSNTPGAPTYDIHYGGPLNLAVTGKFFGGAADRIGVTQPNA